MTSPEERIHFLADILNDAIDNISQAIRQTPEAPDWAAPTLDVLRERLVEYVQTWNDK